MNYTLHQLRVFECVAQLSSITKAANELHMSQPAVSIQLRNFQAQFELPLTEQVGRNIIITPFGSEIAQAAQVILAQVENINHRVLSHKGLLSGKLRISVVSTGKYVMPYFLSQFLRDHPGIELSMDVTNRSSVLHSLSLNEIDFALVSILPNDLEVEYTTFMNNELHLVGRPDLNQHGKTGEQILRTEALIFRESGSGTRSTMERFLEKKKIRIRKGLELTSNEAVKQSLLAGLGYSIMPLIGIRQEIKEKKLEIIPVGGFPLVTSWRLIWLKNKNLSPAAAEYLTFLNENKNQIIDDFFSFS